MGQDLLYTYRIFPFCLKGIVSGRTRFGSGGTSDQPSAIGYDLSVGRIFGAEQLTTCGCWGAGRQAWVRVNWRCVASYLPRLRSFLSALIWLVLVFICALVPGSRAAFGRSGESPSGTVFRPADPLNQAAFEHYYNLDYDLAVQDFERILARHPNDPFAVNHLLSAVQVRELYRMGAMNTGEYANDSFIGQAHRPADPVQRERIKQLVEQAEKLEDDALARDPNNVDMLYARGVTRGQFALYTALIERAWFSSLRNAVGARRDHERVLELSPGYTDAKLVVGAHYYVTGSLSFAVKMAVALAGLSGDKDKGLHYLSDAYHSNGETSVDAGIVLMVFLRREHRFDEALRIARDIGPKFPRNYLLPLEEGNLLRASGKTVGGRRAVPAGLAERARGEVRQSPLRDRGIGAGGLAARREEISGRGRGV